LYSFSDVTAATALSEIISYRPPLTTRKRTSQEMGFVGVKLNVI
jgi:hypothetical protein